MAKKGRAGNGYVGLFGRRKGPTLWISGNVPALEFRLAKQSLVELYEVVYGRRPTRITKTDVVEYALMATRPGSEAYDKLRKLRRLRAEERAVG